MYCVENDISIVLICITEQTRFLTNITLAPVVYVWQWFYVYNRVTLSSGGKNELNKWNLKKTILKQHCQINVQI